MRGGILALAVAPLIAGSALAQTMRALKNSLPTVTTIWNARGEVRASPSTWLFVTACPSAAMRNAVPAASLW